MSIGTKKYKIYLDNAASAPIDPKVKQEMAKTMELYGNPSSFNDAGRIARKKLDESRLAIARFLGARPEEIIFTSSGSEANNMAIFGLVRGFSKRGEIITTPIEHPSVLEPLKILQKEGWRITYLKVDKEGIADLKDFEKKLNPKVKLVSIIYSNNEIGTIQPIKKISQIMKNPTPKTYNLKPIFHVDACQATEYLDMNVNNLGVDLMTFNGTKLYGPRGMGVLYVRRGTLLQPIIYGGDQEHGLRAGTENLPAVAGLAKAVLMIDRKEGRRLTELRDYFFEKITKLIPDIKINGPTFAPSFARGFRGQGKATAGKPLGQNRLPNNINISIPSLDSENLLLELDKYGIYASSGSACTARSVEPSHVLKAIGVDKKYLSGALRFSLGRQTTKKDIDYVLKVLPKVVGDLRKRYKSN